MRGAAALACAVLLGVPPRAGGQEPGARAALVSVEVRPESVTVGAPFTVRVRVRASKIAAIRFPAVPDSADAIEAIDPRAIEDAGDLTALDRTAVYRLVAWNTGSRTPHLGDVAVTVAGVEQRYRVAVPPVVVRSLLPADSALRVPKDARTPVPSPGGAWRYWLLAGVLTAGLGWYWWRSRRRRRARAPNEVEPFAAAGEAFLALESLGLAEAGEPGRHVIAHVDILRRYVARRFPSAPESLTSGEFVRALGAAEFPVLPERVGALLDQEAAVRYAAAPIAPEAAVALAREARQIVTDVQAAHDARLRALDRGPRRVRRQGRR